MKGKFIQFIKECKTELKDKTTWPTKDQVINTTIVVIVSIVISSVSFYFVDWISHLVIKQLTVDAKDITKQFITPLTYLLFVAAMIVFVFLGKQIKKRLSKY